VQQRMGAGFRGVRARDSAQLRDSSRRSISCHNPPDQETGNAVPVALAQCPTTACESQRQTRVVTVRGSYKNSFHLPKTTVLRLSVFSNHQSTALNRSRPRELFHIGSFISSNGASADRMPHRGRYENEDSLHKEAYTVVVCYCTSRIDGQIYHIGLRMMTGQVCSFLGFRLCTDFLPWLGCRQANEEGR